MHAINGRCRHQCNNLGRQASKLDDTHKDQFNHARIAQSKKQAYYETIRLSDGDETIPLTILVETTD